MVEVSTSETAKKVNILAGNDLQTQVGQCLLI